jgi:structure-specific recognition protein 1
MPYYSESFDNIYLDLSKESGKCRFAETGLGWKPAGGGEAFTLDQSSFGGAHWSRAARGYEVKILLRNSGIVQLDGFAQEDYERLSKLFKNWYSTTLENKEHSLRGWNWGKAEFGKAELTFNVQNRPAFEIPYSEIWNTNLAGRNEIAVEFSTSDDAKANGQNGATPGKGKRAAAGRDQLVEMRFYIPGTTTRKEAEGDDAASDADEEEKNAVSLFYDTLMEKAEIGETAGDTIATFLDVLHLTPRYDCADGPHVRVAALLTWLQRTVRYRYVRYVLQVARQDIRLQDPVRGYQEVHDPSEARRSSRHALHRIRPTSSPGSDEVSVRHHAI